MRNDLIEGLPYMAIKELIALREYLDPLINSNLEIFTQQETDFSDYLFVDKTGRYSFTVSFVEVDRNKQINSYHITYDPVNLNDLQGTTIGGNLETIKINLDNWIGIIKKMHEVFEEYRNPNKKFYDDEFADYFTNDDEDCLINPFEIDKQQVIYKYLEFAEEQVKISDTITEEIRGQLLEEVKGLKEDISNLAKKPFAAKLSKFAQHTKKASNKLFSDIFDVMKKEFIKKLLYEVVEALPGIVNKAQHLIEIFMTTPK